MKERMRVVLRSNIIADYLKGMRHREIKKKYRCSSSTVTKWINFYKEKKKEMESVGKALRIRQERTARAERSLRGERGLRPPELTKEQKAENLEKQIWDDLDKIDLTRKKPKFKLTRIPFKIQQYLYKQFADRRTGGKEGRSIRKVVAKANKKFKLKDWKKMKEFVPKEQRKLSFGAVQSFLVLKFGKARKLIKKPLLKPSHISQRKAFSEYIIKNGIDHTKIFFTDEKRFIMNFVPNKQTNQIRLSKKTQRQLKQNNEEVEKLLTIPVEKNPKGVMVAGGVSYYGVGKLNFIIGAMDSCAYAQTLKFYQKDIEYYKTMGVDLIFQQDNSPSHVSAEIKEILGKMHKLDFWPPNSPDLSPIEMVWSEVQSKLEGYTFKSMDDFKKKIVYEWNRVPVDYCQRVSDKFIDDINQIYKFGRIKEKHHISKGLISRQKGVFRDEIENIVYNKVSLKNVIKYNIKDLKKANKRLVPIINKLRNTNFKKKIQEEINIVSFDNIYKEILKENEDIYYKNKNEISKLKKTTLQEYFDNLTRLQKLKLCNLVPKYNDEIKEIKNVDYSNEIKLLPEAKNENNKENDKNDGTMMKDEEEKKEKFEIITSSEKNEIKLQTDISGKKGKGKKEINKTPIKSKVKEIKKTPIKSKVKNVHKTPIKQKPKDNVITLINDSDDEVIHLD